MNRTDFLNTEAVAAFTTWLAVNSDTLIIDLDIKQSRFVLKGIKIDLVGMNAVLQQYVWRSGGTANGLWPETKKHLGDLAAALKLALSPKGNDDAAMTACRQILSWGGDRNSRVGASPFLEELHASNRLSAYLNAAKSAFQLDETLTDSASPPVTRMNSMLTKVHALASEDGLPIYDSRVAAAIAALVELWRRDTGLPGEDLPDELRFPATLTGRTVQHLFGDATAPGVMSYAPAKTQQTARQWSGAKIRLAWVMAEVLRKAGKLFASEASAKAPDRMHAFEATLFIIGYDVRCLARNSAMAKVDAKQLRKLETTAIKTLAEEQRELPSTTISTLARSKQNLNYSGDIETGITGTWSDTRFAFERDFLQELLGNFQAMENVKLGADINGQGAEGTLGHWVANNHARLSPKYASAIAAILVNEGLASRVTGSWPIQLNFTNRAPFQAKQAASRQ